MPSVYKIQHISYDCNPATAIFPENNLGVQIYIHYVHQPSFDRLIYNSIAPKLLPRLDQIYVEHYKEYIVSRLHTHEVPTEKFRKVRRDMLPV
ncbi:hypothetical protein BDV34DRAFT_35555 [Aspergillus parasiticus]|uniref:Uncharacterized protein n=1 Tax=Aspergillus parasiticus TaxID=5067 RepID=A0A5N6D2V8_ASPPA|nr:hypothetical protein BDV34DRAFT_35555 [Aspergillus parasiticus]